MHSLAHIDACVCSANDNGHHQMYQSTLYTDDGNNLLVDLSDVPPNTAGQIPY